MTWRDWLFAIVTFGFGPILRMTRAMQERERELRDPNFIEREWLGGHDHD